MRNKILIFLASWGILLLVGLIWPAAIAASTQTRPVRLYFFWAKGCPHCAKEEAFLVKLKKKYPIEIKRFEVTTKPANARLLNRISQQLAIDIPGVPFTAVGQSHFVGFLDEQTTGKRIEEAVKSAWQDKENDLLAGIVGAQKQTVRREKKPPLPEVLNLPIFGKIKTKNLSLPVFTLVIGLLDGFNPCAMWVLIFLISLLLGMKNRKKMWLLGMTFIVASGAVYFLFMTAWLNLFLFLGLVLWVRVLIGLAALGAGGYNLRDYWVNREGGCEAAGEQKRQKILARVKRVVYEKHFLLGLAGIIFLAFSVNLIELICSAGLPAIYTQVLALSKLPSWQYYLYLLLYIFVFMADDLFVFIVAMVTLRAVGIQSKYARWSKLIGGILMLVIGFLLLFKPEWLMFG